MDMVSAMVQGASDVREETKAAKRAAKAEREADAAARAKVRALGEDGLVAVLRSAEELADAAYAFGRTGRFAQAMDMKSAIVAFRKATRGEL